MWPFDIFKKRREAEQKSRLEAMERLQRDQDYIARHALERSRKVQSVTARQAMEQGVSPDAPWRVSMKRNGHVKTMDIPTCRVEYYRTRGWDAGY